MRIAPGRISADTSASSAKVQGLEKSTQSTGSNEAQGAALPSAQPSPELLALQRLLALRAPPEKRAVQQQVQNPAPSPFALEPIPAPPLVPGVAETGQETGEQKQAIERQKSDFAKQTLTQLAALPDDGLTKELIRLSDDAQLGAVAHYAEEPEHEQYLRPILRRLPRGTALPGPLRIAVRTIFDYTQDTNTRTLELAASVYFKIDVDSYASPARSPTWSMRNSRTSTSTASNGSSSIRCSTSRNGRILNTSPVRSSSAP